MRLFQVDAFNNQFFSGNPAAVVPLDSWISNDLMQAIAEENNLSETVFFVPNGEDFDIKWFTPTCEIDLCGHATLAAAHILFTEMNYSRDELIFNSKSGKLRVSKDQGWYALNFPSEDVKEIKIPDLLEAALDCRVAACFQGKWKMMVLLDKESTIEQLSPDFGLLSKLDAPGIIVTAKGNEVDFVSRFFAPRLGINEDPVTGSAHTLLIPFWAKRLNKNELKALQISKRMGVLKCRFLTNRVEMCGEAITYLRGNIELNS